MLLLLVGACSAEAIEEGRPVRPQVAGTHQHVFMNGDFENNDIGDVPTPWTVKRAINTGITRMTPQTFAGLALNEGMGQQQTFVVGGAPESQPDPDLGPAAPVRFPKYGARAARVNYLSAAASTMNMNKGANKNANILEQTTTMTVGDVDPTDGKIHIRFGILPVLQNPAHEDREQPYYYVHVYNATRGEDLYRDFNTSGQVGVPWRTAGSGTDSIYYTDWQLVDVAPGDSRLRVGDSVTLRIVAAGCSPGGHWGRVYVDAVGSGIPGLYSWASAVQSANRGSNLTYTVNYKNGSSAVTEGTTFTMPMPASTTYVSSTGPGCTISGTSPVLLTCPLGRLAQGAVGSFAVTVNIAANTAVNTVITNGSYAIAATGVSALIGPKVQTTVTNGATYADVSVTQSNGVASLGWGDAVTYTVAVTNRGPASATNVTVTDVIPAQLSGASWTCAAGAGATCASAGTGSISDVVMLQAGATVTYTVSATVAAGSGTGAVSHTVTAKVAGATDPDTSNDTAVDTDSIGTLQTLMLSKVLDGSGEGTVRSTPGAIDCGVGCTADTKRFVEGSEVMLSAIPASGAAFLGWSGACASAGRTPTCTVTMSAAQSVSARFTSQFLAAAGGTGQRVRRGNQFGMPLRVRVTDAMGAAIPGVTVDFSAPSSGASATLSGTTEVTDMMGYAQVTATANGTGGDYAVTASNVASGGTATFLLSNLAPRSIAVVGASTGSTGVTTAFPTLTVEVRDQFGNILADEPVSFTVVPSMGASATLSSSGGTTNGSGRVSTTATAGTVAGSFTVVASAGPDVTATFSLTNVAGAPHSIAVSAGGTSATVGTSFTPAPTFVVRDVHENPLAGRTVTFSVPSTGASATLAAASGSTSATGLVSVATTANTIPGSYVLTATAMGVAAPATLTLTNTPGVPAQVRPRAASATQSTIVGTAFTQPLAVTVFDASDNPVGAGVDVTFTFPSASGATATSAGTTMATTDAAGVATLPVAANTVAGTYAVTASVSGATSGTFNLTNLPGAAFAVAGSGAQSATVKTAFTALAATVVDEHGNGVPGVAVTFAAPSIGPSAVLGASTAVVTGAGGVAIMPATANARAGSYAVQVSAAGVTTPATIMLTNTAAAASKASISAGSGQSATVLAAFATALTVLVEDADDNPVAGVVVSFAAPASGATATLSGTAAMTDAQGLASVTATAGSVSGSYRVTATVAGVATPLDIMLTNLPGPATMFSVESGSGQSQVVAMPFAQPLIVQVRDAQGNGVPSVAVAYTAPSAGATATLSAPSATTDASGRAQVTATAGQSTGTYVVDAVAGGMMTSFTLTNTAGMAGSIAVVSGDPQSAVVDTPFATSLVTLVSDASAIPCRESWSRSPRRRRMRRRSSARRPL